MMTGGTPMTQETSDPGTRYPGPGMHIHGLGLSDPLQNIVLADSEGFCQGNQGPLAKPRSFEDKLDKIQGWTFFL